MAIPMTSLIRAANGDWFARKVIPADVRATYKTTFGAGIEERFRLSGTVQAGKAKQEFRDWDAKVVSRIEGLRAKAKGEGQSLTHRQAHGLAGEWYRWFVAQHEEEPGEAESWELIHEELDAPYRRYGLSGTEAPEDVPEKVHRMVRARLADIGRASEFLAAREIILTNEAMTLFLEVLRDEFPAATELLRRRAGGDYRPDKRPEQFPSMSTAAKLAGLNSYALFEAWVKERRPAPATVNRWRSVFLGLDKHFSAKDVASISTTDAIGWKDTLVTEERSAQVANDTWLRAASLVFAWAADNKKIAQNPFADVSIAVSATQTEVREREFVEQEWTTILQATLEPAPVKMKPYNKSARRWVPWICAYTGARPGEVTQLRAEDIAQHRDGFWTMRVTPDAGTVKNRKARIVPLHGHLIQQGLIAFVQSVGKGPLFYDPKSKRTVRDDLANPSRSSAVKARDKLSEWVRSLGVNDPNISPSHAWRHTFKRRAARAKIERRIRWAMCGHSSRDEGDSYETPTIEDLAEEMKRFPRYEWRAPNTAA